MIPPLPPVLAARHTIKAVWLALLVAVFVFVSGFAIVQTVRIEGFKFLVFEKQGYKAENKRLLSEIVALIEASKDAAGAQKKVNDTAEQTYSNIAETIDETNNAELQAELDRANAFIRANGMRTQGYSREPCRTITRAQDSGAGSGEEASAAPIVDEPEGQTIASTGVLVEPADILICTRNTVQAEAAYDWAQKIEAASDPDKEGEAIQSDLSDLDR